MSRQGGRSADKQGCMYIIYDKACMYNQDERLVGRSADKQGWGLNVDLNLYIIYDKLCMYIQDERYVGRSAHRQTRSYIYTSHLYHTYILGASAGRQINSGD